MNGVPSPIACVGHTSRAASFDAPATTKAMPSNIDATKETTSMPRSSVADVDGEPLARAEHLEPRASAAGVGLVDEVVDHVVAVGRVVVEEGERLHTALCGEPHGVLNRAMPPRRLHAELFGRVLSVVDQQVGTLAQLARTIGHLEHVDAGLLVVTQICDRGPVPCHP